MPLFKVARVNTIRQSFYVSFKFLKGEDIEDLVGALKNI
jgi:hypothetical protein